jgi:hypothetical protein
VLAGRRAESEEEEPFVMVHRDDLVV